jgi:hypothetical protein
LFTALTSFQLEFIASTASTVGSNAEVMKQVHGMLQQVLTGLNATKSA